MGMADGRLKKTPPYITWVIAFQSPTNLAGSTDFNGMRHISKYT